MLILLVSSMHIYAQGIVRVTVTNIATLTSEDCDPGGPFGIGDSDSDFVWEYQATDNTVGNTNNNGEIPLTDVNFSFNNNSNGPYSQNPNELFFNHQYDCPSIFPSQININWEAYENDDLTNYGLLLTQGETGLQSVSIPVPAFGNTNFQTFMASGSGGGCNQDFSITFSVEAISVPVSLIADNICDAAQIVVGSGTNDFSWCGNQTFEAGEPTPGGDLPNHGSGWVYFQAPPQGAVDISTDVGSTDFGTEIVVYHAADGPGCSQGVAPDGTVVKTKYDYLSYMSEADLGGFLNLEGEADMAMNSCVQTLVDLDLFVSPALVPWQYYYIQVSTDGNNEFGEIGINVSDLNGPAANFSDIPCTDVNIPVTQTMQASPGPPTVVFSASCSFDQEVQGDVIEAYTTVNTLEADDLTESNWFDFVAPCSGAISMEVDIPSILGVQGESIYMYAHDPAFSPGTPTDHSCANIEIPNNDFNTYYDDGTFFGFNTAAIQVTCLEPGYTYFGMIDPQTISLGNREVWLYDPGSNAPGNDILCLTLDDPTFEVPVQLLGAPATPQVGGDNTNACYEQLAGEPSSSPTGATADQTTWHYFTAPPSGVVDITVSAGSISQVNFNVYALFNGGDCYGGLANDGVGCPSPNGSAGRTFTTNGTQSTPVISSLGSGIANVSPTTIQVCCLVPGDTYAIQVDGGAVGDAGSYSIDNISEVEVMAGNTAYLDLDGDTYDGQSAVPDIGIICYGESISASSSNTILPSSGCLDEGFLLHNTENPMLPYDPITVYDSRPPGTGGQFDNNGTGVSPPFNTVIYVSALVDEIATWGDYCPSARIEDTAPVVFLEPISFNNPTVNDQSCVVSVDVSGGLPAYDGSDFDYEISSGSTPFATGTVSQNGTIVFNAPINLIYTVTVTDDEGCMETTMIDATSISCIDPCILYNPIGVFPNPIDETVYDCDPVDQSATVTITLLGGKPESDGSNYLVTVSGSNAGGNVTDDPVTGMVGGTVSYTFEVADGDNWSVSVTDEDACDAGMASGQFDFDQTNCADLCLNAPISVSADFEYACLGGGLAEVTISFEGGIPSLDNGSTGYEVTISGTTPSDGVFTVASNGGGVTTYTFTVNDGDNWLANITDILDCPAASVGDEFNEDNVDCAELCNQNPLVSIAPGFEYNCLGGGLAEVTITFEGGLPTFDGGATGYEVTVSGTTSADGNFNVASNGGGPTSYIFTVNDGDIWMASVTDELGCPPVDIGDQFIEDATNCAELCLSNPIITGGVEFEYNCLGGGQAEVFIAFGGGLPAVDGGSTGYSVTVTGTNMSDGTFAVASDGGGITTYSFIVNDGNNWTVSITDDLGCPPAIITDLFEEDATDCSEICDTFPIQIAPPDFIYNCLGGGVAEVTISFEGGLPSLDGGSTGYSVTVSGTSMSNGNFAVASNSGGLTSYTFVVNDGNSWTVSVTDDLGCTPTEVSDLFEEDATDCSEICNTSPLQIVDPDFMYMCLGEGAAEVTVSFDGGLPSIDGGNSGYEVTVSGTTSSNGVFNVASNGGGITTYTFTVNDGNSWTGSITDTLGCDAVSISDQFIEDEADCMDVCDMAPVIIITPELEIDCIGDGMAQATITVEGGLPSIDGGTSDYELTISGTTGANGIFTLNSDNGGPSSFIFTLNDGDNWNISVTDALGCPPATTSGTFVEDLTGCAETCADLDAILLNNGADYMYECDGAGNAVVALSVSGGLPGMDMGATGYTLELSLDGMTFFEEIEPGETYFLPLSDGQTWSAIAYDDIGCTSDDYGALEEIKFTALVAEAGDDVEIYLGESTQLNGSGGPMFMWMPTGSLSDPTVEDPIATPSETTTYYLNVSDELGCSAADSVTVTVVDELDCLSTNVGFSPNDDGVNDVWVIECIEFFSTELQVYNRWGQLVFEATNYGNNWDGTFKGKPLPDGTYYYILTVRDTPGRNVFKGTVTIIR